MLEHLMADFERDDDLSPARLSDAGHRWIRTEMLTRAKGGSGLLYNVATAMESRNADWTPAEIARLRDAARLLDELALRLWLSSLFGMSYERE